MGVKKLSASDLERARTKGVIVDEILGTPEAVVTSDKFDEEVDIEAEKLKAKSCKFWPNKDEFLGKFKYDTVDGSVENKLKGILYDFRHVFMNDDYPEQMKRGIIVDPIKIRLEERGWTRNLKTCKVSQRLEPFFV